MRKYQPIWEQLKVHKEATLVGVLPSIYPRIVQAVRKERTKDIPFRNLLNKTGVVMQLHHFFNEDKGILELKLIKIRVVATVDNL